MSGISYPPPIKNVAIFDTVLFDDSATSTGITIAQANALYLRKTVADTATAVETFNGGIKTNSIIQRSNANLVIGDATNPVVLQSPSVTLGSGSGSVSIDTATAIIGTGATNVNICSFTANGTATLNLGTKLSNGTINIGSSATPSPAIINMNGTISMGSSTTTTTAYGLTYLGMNLSPNQANASGIEVFSLTNEAMLNFHSSATWNGFDAQLVCEGGNGSAGNGTLTTFAAIQNLGTSAAPCTVNITGTLKTTTITTPTTTGTLTIANNQTAGGNVNIGSATSIVNVSGTLKTNTITTPTTTGTLTIAGDQIAGGNVNIGSATSITSLNGKTNIGGGDNSPSQMLNITTQSFAKRDGIGIRSSAQNSSYFVTFINQANNVCGKIYGTDGNAVFYDTTSDRRMKKDISMMEGMLDKIMALKPSTYRWISNDAQSDGFIAQEVYEVFPQMRIKPSNSCDNIDEPCDKDTGEPIYYGVDYGRFTPYIVKAIQEIKQDYETKLSKLEERIRALEGK